MTYYECMKALPEGSDSPSRLAFVAKRLGYKGIIVCNEEPNRVFRPEAARNIKGMDVILGAEIAGANPRVLRSRVSVLRGGYPFILVRCRSEEMVRAACEDPNIDVLLLIEGKRQFLGIAAARAARQNKVAIGLDLGFFACLRGSSRSRWLETTKRNLELVRKFDLSTIITLCGSSHLDLRAPRDLLALAKMAGFEDWEAETALRLPGKLVELNKRNWVGPGVELL